MRENLCLTSGCDLVILMQCNAPHSAWPGCPLCWQHCLSFFLWSCCSAQIILLQHLHWWADHLHHGGTGTIITLIGILLSYLSIGVSILYQRDLHSLIHLSLLPLCGVSILWNSYDPIHFTLIKEIQWQICNCCSDIHSGQPPVKPLHLQPEEQGHEGGSAETFQEGDIFLQVTITKPFQFLVHQMTLSEIHQRKTVQLTILVPGTLPTSLFLVTCFDGSSFLLLLKPVNSFKAPCTDTSNDTCYNHLCSLSWFLFTLVLFYVCVYISLGLWHIQKHHYLRCLQSTELLWSGVGIVILNNYSIALYSWIDPKYPCFETCFLFEEKEIFDCKFIRYLDLLGIFITYVLTFFKFLLPVLKEIRSVKCDVVWKCHVFMWISYIDLYQCSWNSSIDNENTKWLYKINGNLYFSNQLLVSCSINIFFLEF